MRSLFGPSTELVPARNLSIGDKIMTKGSRACVRMLTELPSGSLVADVTIDGKLQQTFLRPLQLVEKIRG